MGGRMITAITTTTTIVYYIDINDLVNDKNEMKLISLKGGMYIFIFKFKLVILYHRQTKKECDIKKLEWLNNENENGI